MSFKRLSSEVGNLDDEGEPFFQSPLFKESKIVIVFIKSL